MIKTKNPGILKAMEKVRNFSLNPHLRLRYEAYLKDRRDQHAIEAYIRDEGIEQGRVQGIEQGIEQGIFQGRLEGKAEGGIFALAGLVHDGLISLSVAAERASMTEAEFEAAAAELGLLGALGAFLRRRKKD